MSDKIYVVTVTEGMHSDREVRLLAGFKTREEAEDWEKKASESYESIVRRLESSRGESALSMYRGTPYDASADLRFSALLAYEVQEAYMSPTPSPANGPRPLRQYEKKGDALKGDALLEALGLKKGVAS